MSKLKKLPGGMMLMPVDTSDGKCGECATKHEPEMPHNAQSLFYGMRFKMRYGREGTWADALAHCSPEVQEYWRTQLGHAGAWTEPPEGVDPISEPIDG